jgi:hypothetical protein
MKSQPREFFTLKYEMDIKGLSRYVKYVVEDFARTKSEFIAVLKVKINHLEDKMNTPINDL